MNLRLVSGLLLALTCVTALAAPVQADHVEAELIAERDGWVPGVDNWVALRLRPDPEWHVYWRNPGDSGIPTSLSWTLPAGVTAGDLHWPYPHRHSLGELTNYGYGEETLHLVPVRVAADAKGAIKLAAQAKWLVCRDVCIPGSADLTLERPVRANAAIDPDWAPSFSAARAQLPRDGRAWSAQFQIDNDTLSLALRAPALEAVEAIEFYPYANDLVNHAAAQRLIRDDAQTWRLSQTLSPYFVDAPPRAEGVVVLRQGRAVQAWEVGAQPGLVAPVPAAALTPAPTGHHNPATAPAASTAPLGWVAILAFALLGGLILNLMPCVFPVLALKALALAQSGGENRNERRRQALAYTAGVVLSCVAIAALMLGLRSAGQAVGWGFQLQSPGFVAALVYLLFALGLVLSGAAQIGVGWMNLGSNLAQRPGLAGSFFTGVLAVVVATPCTAPFMGTALGYAMTQPAAAALIVFAVLGLGLALPFLLIGFVPALARFLPRPGAWMERFKQVMAFPLYLTAVWLLWVLTRQADAQAMARVLVGLVLIAFALWLWPLRGVIAAMLKLAALAGAVALAATINTAPAQSATPDVALLPGSEPWSTQRVAELRAQGRTILVDFTADWCITCKVNERSSLRSTRVQQALRDHEAAVLVGDWTRADPAITAELARFGRNGVPLYLVYVDGGEPQVLPQILSPDLVIAALQRKGDSR
ncbi:MAG TPA: protein-disulfide reductase DsbD domain-containing protein [Solimonas sp.]